MKKSKKKDREKKKSLLDILSANLFITNLIIIGFLLIAPFIMYELFVDTQYAKFISYLKNNPDVTAFDVGMKAINEGYDVENSFVPIFEENNELCTVNSSKVIEPDGKGARQIIVRFNGNCDNMVISLNNILLHGFINFYFLLTLVTFLLVIGVNIWNFYRVKREINGAFDQVNDEIIKIQSLRLEEMDDNGRTFVEFQEILDNIHRLNAEINSYLNERHTLVSSLNHELKSPINKINSVVQAYQMQIPGYDKIEDVIDVINEEMSIMLNIVNYSLNIFVNTQLKDEAAMNCNELIEELVERKSREMSLKGLECEEFGDEILLTSDERIMRLVFSNLIENITKYARRNSTFTIEYLDDQIIFTNEIEPNQNVGTQQGLKLSSQLLKSINHELVYSVQEDLFVVEITLEK